MDIRRILGLSSQAICGINEREIVVKKSNKAKIINLLKRSGYMIVGTGSAGSDTVKIWFAKGGLLF